MTDFETNYDENELETLNTQDEWVLEDECAEREKEELDFFIHSYKCESCMELATKVVAYMSHYFTLDGIAKRLDLNEGSVKIDSGYDMMMEFYYYSDDPNAEYWQDFISNNYEEINKIMKEAKKWTN